MTQKGRYWRWGGLAALGLIASWSCSSDREFNDPNNAESGAGAGAAAGEATEPSAGADPGSGGSGTAGAPAEEAFAIVAVSPLDEATDVERDAIVQVTFSTELDPQTVSQESLKISGPLGTVAGDLAVEGDTVTFSPKSPWHLLTTYTVEVSTAVADRDGQKMSDSAEFEFQVRDGVFTAPKRLWNGAGLSLEVSGSQSGHVAVMWTDGASPASRQVTVYDPVEGAWSMAEPPESDMASDRSEGCIGTNDAGEVVALVGANSSWLSNRWSVDSWGVAQPAAFVRGETCALDDGGTAMTVWEEIVGNDWGFFAASLSPENVWSDVTTIQTKARSVALSRYGSGFLALHARETGGVYSTVFDAKLGWLSPKPVSPPNVAHNYWSLSTSNEVALWTWIGAGQAQASIYDGAAWSTQELGPVTEGTRGATGASGHLAAWNYQGAAYVARYKLELGWGDPMKLGETTGDYVAPALAIDSAGNSLAAWANQGSVVWRRLRSGDDGWSEPVEIEGQDPYGVSSTIDASGSVMLIWQNPLGVWASRFE